MNDVNEEISALITSLHETQQRLEVLTEGEVDSVADRDGRTFLLRRAQEQLRHSEAAKQAAILNALPAHIALLDSRGVIVSVNEAWRQISCVDAIQGPGLPVGLNYLEICESASGDGSADAHQAANGIRSVLSGEAKSFSTEYPCHSPSERRWFLMTVTPLADERPNGVVVMHLNITEQKHSAEQARAATQLLDNIVENIPTAIQLKSVQDEFRVQMWNKAAEAMYGVPRAAAVGRNVHDLWPRADADRMHAADLDLLSTGSMQDFPDRLAQTKDRGTIHVHMRKVALLDSNGKATHVLVVADDISEQLKRDEDLRRFRAAMDISVDAIVLIDRASMRYIDFNQTVCDMSGCTRQELLRMSPMDLLGQSRATLEREYDALIADSGHVADKVEGQYHRKDGSFISIETRRRALRTENGWIIVGVTHDVTERNRVARELRESERRFSDMLKNIEMVSLMLDTKARITYCNDYLLRLTDRRREEVIGRDWFDLFIPPELSVSKDDHAALLAGKPEALHHENEILTRSGGRRRIRWHNSVLRSGTGTVVGTASIGEDISEQTLAEIRIKRLNRVYAVLSGINSAIVRIRSREELFSEACQIAVAEGEFVLARVVELDSKGTARLAATTESDSRLFQGIVDEYNSDHEHSQSLLALALRSEQPVISNDVANDPRIPKRKALTKESNYALALLPIVVEKRVVGVYILRARDAGMFDEEEMSLLLELVADMSFALEHISKDERLNYLAMYDPLTGLANRALFLERFDQLIQAASSVGNKAALVLADIERFGTINESLGRHAGDAVIKELAARLAGAVGKSGIARVGADQFVIMLQAIKGKSEVTRRIDVLWQSWLGEPFRVLGTELRIAAKAGITLFPNDGSAAELLLRNAEAALVKTKQLGERYVFYTSALTERIGERLTLENRLRQALENNEFVLHYQPKVELETRRIVGVEALIRWQNPELGLVPPGNFIPLMEETGLILDVGAWALDKAIDDHLRWEKLGMLAPRVAVNVSAIQLRRRDFFATIEAALRRGAVPPGIDLELTESLVMEDIESTMHKLKQIRELGMSIAIDDFGTGYSSLGYLARLPVQTLKIDRSFIITMLKDSNTMTLVQTIISLAHSLRLKVIAEGVDEEEQAKMLRLLRCDEMQGYLFSKPIPFAEMTVLLEHGRQA